MSKNEFLTRLSRALSELPQSEIQKTLDYYTEIINDAIEDGKNEDEIILDLGSINDISKKIIAETKPQNSANNDINFKNHKITLPVIILLIISSPVWLSVIIALFAVIFSIYISVWSVVVSLFVTALSLAVSGLAFLISVPFLLFGTNPVKALFMLGSALACVGAGILIFYLSLWCTKTLIRLTVYLANKTKKIFKKKEGAAIESK